MWGFLFSSSCLPLPRPRVPYSCTECRVRARERGKENPKLFSHDRAPVHRPSKTNRTNGCTAWRAPAVESGANSCEYSIEKLDDASSRKKIRPGNLFWLPVSSSHIFSTAGEGKCNPRPCPAAIPFLSLSKTPPAQLAFSVSLPPPTFFWQTPPPPFSFQLVRKKETVQKKKEPLPSYNPSAHDNVWSVRGHFYS